MSHGDIIFPTLDFMEWEANLLKINVLSWKGIEHTIYK